MSSNYGPGGAYNAPRPLPPSAPSGPNPAAALRRRPVARYELTDEQKAEIREAFEIFDMDKDGALDFHEFKVCLSVGDDHADDDVGGIAGSGL